MFSACKKSAIALLLGIVGLCAAPAEAQKPPRLLFLGISKDGRAQQHAEHAVQLRLEGLNVSVVRSTALPPCEQPDCVSDALTLEKADLALTGRVLRNDHACLATLWLAANNDHGKPIAQDIACRADANDNELTGSLADGAAVLLEDYLRSQEPAPSNQLSQLIITDKTSEKPTDKKELRPWRRKTAIAALSGLSFIAISTAIILPILEGKIYQKNNDLYTPISLAPYSTLSGIVGGAAAMSIVLLTVKR